MYTVNKAWEEASVTWVNAKTNDPWTTKGGDFNSNNPVVVNYAPEGAWEKYDVTDAIKNFAANPTTNFGFNFVSGECNKGRYYYSGNFTNQTLRPKLTIIVKK